MKNEGFIADRKVTLKYVGKCLVGGVAGFMIFIMTIAGAKFLSHMFGRLQHFNIDSDDYYLSLIGFAMFFIIKLLEPFAEKENEVSRF
ncbi:MAG: hypothetical protein M1480_14690 [Bacteroidetes bacterium]|nr:hypothetical protein [Bacteroidota bacterium]